MKARLIYAFLGLSLVTLPATSQSTRRWSPQEDGSIIWNIRNDLPHSDHIEMSGKSVSVVLRYGVDREGNFTLNKGMVWPLLRTVPNNTHASLMRRSAWNPLDAVLVNSRSLTEEKVESISLNGILTVESRFDKGYYGQWKLIREYFPAKTPCRWKFPKNRHVRKPIRKTELPEPISWKEQSTEVARTQSCRAIRFTLQLPCPPIVKEHPPSGCNRKQKRPNEWIS